MEEKAGEVAGILRMLANERRVMILCKLVQAGEANVTMLAESIGLSQSALSQHLAKMRAEGLVTTRRESQTIWYRVADPRIEQLFATLYALFCAEPKTISGLERNRLPGTGRAHEFSGRDRDEPGVPPSAASLRRRMKWRQR
jgi:ArsR family transcriptional regulator